VSFTGCHLNDKELVGIDLAKSSNHIIIKYDYYDKNRNYLFIKSSLGSFLNDVEISTRLFLHNYYIKGAISQATVKIGLEETGVLVKIYIKGCDAKTLKNIMHEYDDIFHDVKQDSKILTVTFPVNSIFFLDGKEIRSGRVRI
jgi:hypothetical protein